MSCWRWGFSPGMWTQKVLGGFKVPPSSVECLSVECSVQSFEGRRTERGLYRTGVCSINSQITLTVVWWWKGLHITFTVLCKNIKDMLYIFTQFLNVICGFFFFIYYCMRGLGPSVGRIKSLCISCVIYSVLLNVSYILMVLQQWLLTQGPHSFVHIQICNIMCLCLLPNEL